MKPIIRSIFVTGSIMIARGDHGEFKDCYSCAAQDNGNRYICNWGDYLEDKIEMPCCVEGSNSPFCNKNADQNECSLPYNKMGGIFFNYCPRVFIDQCPDENVETESEPKIIKNDLVYAPDLRKFETCYHVIRNNEINYGSGNTLLKFSKIENVVISIHKGKDALDKEAVDLKFDPAFDFESSEFQAPND